jgi:SAM-dependent methyltransferase
MSSDISVLKARLKATWMAGDFGHFATYMLSGAMEFYPAIGIKRGLRVLDVGCGAGQLALPAARDGAQITAVDIATNLIEQGRASAAKEGLSVKFEEGDAEALAFPDASFDLVFSFIGAMFAPRPDLVAAELTRVCRPGGRIVMGNWTPTGFVGEMFKTVGRHVPPPAGVPPFALWGDEKTVEERFGSRVKDLRMKRRMFPFAYPFPPAGVVELFIDYYGPTNRAHASLDPERQKAFRSDLTRLWTSANRATDGTTRVDGEYLEVVAIRA